MHLTRNAMIHVNILFLKRENWKWPISHRHIDQTLRYQRCTSTLTLNEQISIAFSDWNKWGSNSRKELEQMMFSIQIIQMSSMYVSNKFDFSLFYLAQSKKQQNSDLQNFELRWFRGSLSNNDHLTWVVFWHLATINSGNYCRIFANTNWHKQWQKCQPKHPDVSRLTVFQC